MSDRSHGDAQLGSPVAVAVAVVLAAVVLVAAWASAQTSGAGVVRLAEAVVTGVEAQARDGEPWTLPRTPDGRPDLQGIWTNDTITPFERPAQFADKPFLTAEEVANLEAVTAAERAEEERLAENFRGYNRFWLDSGHHGAVERTDVAGCGSIGRESAGQAQCRG